MGQYDQVEYAHEVPAMELTALMSSKICHDLISPIGAIVNGLEIIDESSDDETRRFAHELIEKSAKQASAKLQFARLAWGAAGSMGSSLDSQEAGRMAELYLMSERSSLDWRIPPDLMPKSVIKLLLNMVVVASAAVPRGGTITVEPSGNGFGFYCKGEHSRIPSLHQEILNGNYQPGQIDAHKVHAYYTLLLAQEADMAVTFTISDDTVTIKCLPNTSNY